MIIQLQQITTQFPNAFTEAKRVTKSCIPATSVPTRIVVPIDIKRWVKLETRQKCGQPIGAKDQNLQKEKVASLIESPKEKPREVEDFSQRAIANEEIHVEEMEQLNPPDMAPELVVINKNFEISINFVNIGEKLFIILLIIDKLLPQQQLLLSKDYFRI